MWTRRTDRCDVEAAVLPTELYAVAELEGSRVSVWAPTCPGSVRTSNHVLVRTFISPESKPVANPAPIRVHLPFLALSFALAFALSFALALSFTFALTFLATSFEP